MRCPINATTGLHLANSMVQGTSLAKMVIEWKMKHNAQTRLKHGCSGSSTAAQETPKMPMPAGVSVVTATTTSAPVEDKAEAGATRITVLPRTVELSADLGLGYWNGFMKRHRNVVRSKQSVKFESKRAEWCTYNNFKTMNDEIYQQMTDRGIAYASTPPRSLA
jgi:hypothetical protein